MIKFHESYRASASSIHRSPFESIDWKTKIEQVHVHIGHSCALQNRTWLKMHWLWCGSFCWYIRLHQAIGSLSSIFLKFWIVSTYDGCRRTNWYLCTSNSVRGFWTVDVLRLWCGQCCNAFYVILSRFLIRYDHTPNRKRRQNHW